MFQAPRVATTDVKHRLDYFLPILRMTRDPAAFVKWNAKTVIKSFKWADILWSLSVHADEVQCKSLADEIEDVCVDFIDRNKVAMLQNPVRTLTEAILTSPVFTWIQDPTKVMQETLDQASTRMGEAAVSALVFQIVEQSMDVRLHLNSLINGRKRLECIAPISNTMAFPWCGIGKCFPSTATEISLAMELIVGLGRLRSGKHSTFATIKIDICEHSSSDDTCTTRSLILQSLQETAMVDKFTLRLLCIALSLPPGIFASYYSVWESAESRGISWQDAFRETLQPDLWLVLYACIEAVFETFLELDADHIICKTLCMKDERFAQLFIEQLINTPMTSTHLIAAQAAASKAFMKPSQNFSTSDELQQRILRIFQG